MENLNLAIYFNLIADLIFLRNQPEKGIEIDVKNTRVFICVFDSQ